jgi:Fic family protein
MIREGRAPRDNSERMILNNFMAMGRVEDLANEPLTMDTIFELHRILVDGTLGPADVGRFRTAEDQVVVELINTVETAHTPPAADELPGRMDDLLAFANGDTPEEWLHPVLRAVIVHFMIGYDHPFVDGNGRVARILFYWTMLRNEYELAKYLSISKILHDAPAKYARAYLFTETDEGDMTYFIDHQLTVIGQSIDALRAYWEGKLRQTNDLEMRLKDHEALNHRQVALLSHALRNPGFKYTITSHENSHRISRATARSDLLTLAKTKLLEKLKSGREFVFLSPRDLDQRIVNLGT